VLYLTTFAAFQLYGLFSQTTAFGFMVLVTVLAGLLALRYDTAWLAILGLIGGFLTPVILSTGQDNQVALMSYMVLLNAGILAIAACKRWRLLNTLGFLLTWLLFTGWFFRHYGLEKFWPTLFFLHVFFLCYVFVPFVYYFLHQSRARLTGLTMSCLNTFVTFAFAFGMVQEYASLRLVSLVTLSYAGLFLGMATLVYRRQQATLEPFILLLAQGTLFLILTVPILFSGHWITLFWAVQSAMLLWAGLRLRHHLLCGGALVLLLLTLGKFVLYDAGELFQLRLDHWRYAGGFTQFLPERWGTAAIVLGALLYNARALGAATPGRWPWQKSAAAVLYGTFATLLFLTLTAEASAGFYAYAPQARFAAVSVLWALFSLALMVWGFLRHRAVPRLCALGLFAVTVLKVFLVDMARASTPFRIISFIVLGLLLIGASYLYYSYRDHLLSGESPGEAR
jgi:uncharacterized membrane protein